MTGVWTEAEDGGDNRPAGQVHPYEDWEFRTRLRRQRRVERLDLPLATPGAGTTHVPLRVDMHHWNPVYVALRADGGGRFAPAARGLIAAIGSGAHLRPGPDAWRQLRTIAECEATRDVAHLTRFFVYRPTCAAYKEIDGVFRVVLVGPAVDHAQVWSGVPDPAAALACDENPVCLDGPVATAVIDDAIGVAHDRLRGASGATRVAWYWRQGAEAAAPGAAMGDIAVGQVLAGAEIDALLAQAGGRERAFYPALEQELARRAARPALTRRDLGPVMASDIAPEHEGADDLTPRRLRALLDGLDPDASLRRAPAVAAARRRPAEFRAAHGTHVADLAAGFDMHDAPANRPVIAVELPARATAETDGARVEVFALQGVIRALDWADNWLVEGRRCRIPLVLNISYGRTAGPKNGQGFLEREIARLVAARDRDVPTKVVLAAGNAHCARLSGEIDLEPGRTETLDWIVQPDDRSSSFLEIRLPGDAEAVLQLDCPTGARLDLAVAAGAVPAIRDWEVGGVPIGRAYLQRPEDEGGHLRVTLALAPTRNWEMPRQAVSCGAYRIALTNTGSAPIEQVHFDVQRDDSLPGYPALGRQSYLEHRSGLVKDPETGSYELPAPGSPLARRRTLSSFATALGPSLFVAGGAFAADHRPPAAQPARYTPAGPGGARTGPDLAAVTEDGRFTPGQRAAGMFSGSTVVFRGTSAAVPQITRRLVELILQRREDIAPGDLSGAALPQPDPRLGHGVLPSAPDQGRAPRRRSWPVSGA